MFIQDVGTTDMHYLKVNDFSFLDIFLHFVVYGPQINCVLLFCTTTSCTTCVCVLRFCHMRQIYSKYLDEFVNVYVCVFVVTYLHEWGRFNFKCFVVLGREILFTPQWMILFYEIKVFNCEFIEKCSSIIY